MSNKTIAIILGTVASVCILLGILEHPTCKQWLDKNVPIACYKFTAGKELTEEFLTAKAAFEMDNSDAATLRMGEAFGAVSCGHALKDTPNTKEEIEACRIVGKGYSWWLLQMFAVNNTENVCLFVKETMIDNVGKSIGKSNDLVTKINYIRRTIPGISDAEVGALILAESASSSPTFLDIDAAYAISIRTNLSYYFAKGSVGRMLSDGFDKEKMNNILVKWYAKRGTVL